MKNKISRFGKFLSGMVMPNIGAFIAWGFLTALFIEKGWVPNADLASIVSPMLTYLLPILIAGQGGYMVAGDRGRVIGTIAVVGCICGSSYTMLMGAMVMGPAAGWVIKQFDRAVDGRIPAGFEMLVNNFSVGILGLILTILGYYVIGPFMTLILTVLSAGVGFLISHSLLPLVSIFVEPAKVLFLNNAINHGIFSPIGASQAAETGRSIMYMLEANPGPGLGVLLAYCLFCKDTTTRQSAPGAVIIHLFGGIHEIYFPYILMNPVVIIAPIVGNMAAILFYTMTGAGLSGVASPGSIIAYMAMAPRDSILTVLLGVVIAAAVSFVIASPIVRMSTAKNLDEATNQMKQMKAQAKGTAIDGAVPSGPVRKIVFSCDAGMGSSAMGATRFRNRIHDARPDLTVTNTSVDAIPADADIVVCQQVLADRARACAPNATLVTIGNFLSDPNLDSLYASLTQAGAAQAASKTEAAASAPSGAMDGVLVRDGIRVGLPSVDKETAIRAAGALLAELGCVDADYADAMVEREKLITTYMGMGVAIPHGTSEKKGTVKKSGVVVMQYPDGVDFGDEKAYLIFGIAGVGDAHLDLLGKICTILEDEDVLDAMKTTNDVDFLLSKLQ
ncbi:PTS mannitol transporter subunit IICBA [Butyricicoccus pullicaecorum]|nr:PTS mannitol transporter subunit IICBA [Butyricicoccus pullicaecorum]